VCPSERKKERLEGHEKERKKKRNEEGSKRERNYFLWLGHDWTLF
jgi:hypothetical protein